MTSVTVVPSRLIGRAELMLLLGVSRNRAVVLSQEPAFPAPRDRLIMGNVWELDEVIAWSEWRGRVLNLHALPDPDHPNTPEPAPPEG